MSNNPITPICANTELLALSEQELCEALGNALQNLELSNADIKNFGDKCLEYPQVDLSVQQYLHAGMYTRSILIPAGTIATGMEVCVDTISVVCGDITVRGEAGIKRYTGYHVLPGCAGKRRIGVAHSDTYWVTVFPTKQSTAEGAYREMIGDEYVSIV